MIKAIHSKGNFIDTCRLAGETKDDEVFPAQHNTVRLARDRWLVAFNTRGFRGNDDHRSVVYQVRGDTPDGPVLSEGFLEGPSMEWDAVGDGRKFMRLCTHPVVFGVPADAVLNGVTPAHAGTFAAVWARFPRVYDVARDYLLHDAEADVPDGGYRCAWVQFRLNAARNDIDIAAPVAVLHEKSYSGDRPFCKHEDLTLMNCGYVNPLPANECGSNWVFLMHWNRGNIDARGCCSAVRFAWNGRTRLYEWVETGPLLDGPGDKGIFEGGIARYESDWLIAARIVPRGSAGNVWFRVNDLFGEVAEPYLSEEIRSHAPRTVFRFPDGVVRVLTTDQAASPYARRGKPGVRMPLHLMDINPDDRFRVTCSRVVFDSFAEGLPLRFASGPCAHFCQLVCHAGGAVSTLTYSVRPKALRKHPVSYTGEYKGLVNEAEIAASGVYQSTVLYDEAYPSVWNFE